MECSRDPVIVPTFYSCHFYLMGGKKRHWWDYAMGFIFGSGLLKKDIDQMDDCVDE